LLLVLFKNSSASASLKNAVKLREKLLNWLLGFAIRLLIGQRFIYTDEKWLQILKKFCQDFSFLGMLLQGLV